MGSEMCIRDRSEGWQLPGELSYWHCHDDSTINVVMAITVIIIIVII